MPIVPNFLLRKMYLKGSLRPIDGGIAFDLKNIIGPGIIIKINCMKVNDHCFDPDSICIITNDKEIPADEISPDNPVLFSFLQKGTCFLKGKTPLINGQNTIDVELISREAGRIKVTVTDVLNVETQ